jgi:hypothetical protein
MVRPSRRSYSRMEQVSDFIVNVLPREEIVASYADEDAAQRLRAGYTFLP